MARRLEDLMDAEDAGRIRKAAQLFNTPAAGVRILKEEEIIQYYWREYEKRKE